MTRALRNIAIIAHVDHGKTTLVDKLLQQSGTFRANQHVAERVMDSNDLERERGITILAKNCAVEYEGTHINIVDTPGHADFGGEVERVLSMVDGVLLLVDAVEGPMPQTRFVTRKALAQGLKPIVVVNKIDRPGARPDYVVNATFDLFDKLGATEEQLDFPVVYASALNGYAGTCARGALGRHAAAVRRRPCARAGAQRRSRRPAAAADLLARLQQLRRQDRHRPHLARTVARRAGRPGAARTRGRGECSRHQRAASTRCSSSRGSSVRWCPEAEAGDIVLINGIDEIGIGTTLCPIDAPDALPLLKVDEPTLVMNFCVNSSPLAGREGKFVTSRQLRERLERELKANVAMRMRETGDETIFEVAGRGELHLTILIENMRREGYELAVSRPRVLLREVDGVRHEPYEMLTVDIEEQNQGAIMEELGRRKGDLQDMQPDGKGRVRLEYRIPARGLIGFQGEFMTLTRGTGLMSHIFDEYAPEKPAAWPTAATACWSARTTARPWPTRCGSCRSAAACSSRLARSSMRAWSSASTRATTT